MTRMSLDTISLGLDDYQRESIWTTKSQNTGTSTRGETDLR